MTKMTAITYRCKCMRSEVTFEMPARRFNEDIEDFMTRMRYYGANATSGFRLAFAHNAVHS